MSQFFTTEMTTDKVKVLTFNRSDMDTNVLSAKVLQELNDLIDTFAADKDVAGLVIISGKKDQFIAGADITEIESFKTAEQAEQGSRLMQAIYTKVANLKFPTVAAIHGACLGGGLELSLACTWRVVTNAEVTSLALPEIQLGLLPGAGGTQRLPRLVGIQAGLDMILTGKRIRGDKAVKMGLADAAVHPSFLKKIAVEFATKKRTDAKKHTLTESALEGNPLGRMVMRKKAKELVEKNTKGFYPAAYKALDAVFKSAETSIDKGLAIEAKYFGELAMTRESNSLIHLFHATTKLKKHPYKDAGKARFGESKSKLVGVIGAGFMGAGIATVALEKNLRVLLSDPNQEAVGRALKHVDEYFGKQVKRKRIKSFQATQKLAHVSPGLSPQGFGKCDIVIEAVFEDLGLKQKLLAETEKSASKDWIFASNTSAIPISEIASKSAHQDRVLGMHFFSPVEKMPLLEIIVTDKTAPWATARAVELGQTMGKQVIIVKDGPGFYTTRALAFFLNEAALMLAEGARIDKVDKALTDFGFPVGPVTLIDEVGIDVGSHVLETMEKSFKDRITVPEGMKVILDSGRLGRKNQKGFYLYAEGKKGEPDPAIYQMLAKYKVSPKGIPSDEIVDRCLLIFVNESIRCLEEGILKDAYDGDVGAVFGLGFPPFWGGPFRYVDHIGAGAILKRLTALEETYGKRFAPAPLLKSMAASNKLFFG